jgi:hypothetical protein
MAGKFAHPLLSFRTWISLWQAVTGETVANLRVPLF